MSVFVKNVNCYLHFIGLILAAECAIHHHNRRWKRKHRKRSFVLRKIKNAIITFIYRIVNTIKRRFQQAMNNAFVATLEYVE